MKSRYRRFSLGALLMIIAAACVGLALWSHAARRQRHALAVLSRLQPERHDTRASGFRGFLGQALGEDYVRTVRYLSVSGSRGGRPAAGWGQPPAFALAEAEAIGSLSSLQHLNLSHTPFADKDLACLAGLVELEWLDLSYTLTTPAGYKALSRCSLLKTLLLNQGATSRDSPRSRAGKRKLCDAQMAFLRDLKSIQTLDLVDLPIGDEAVLYLNGSQELRRLELDGTEISDRAIETLVALPKLEVLMLNDTRISDAGIEQMARRGRLVSLGIQGTAVTDRGLKLLVASPTLRTLNLGDFGESDGLTAQGLVSLGSSPSLRYLTIDGMSLLPSDLRRVRSALPGVHLIVHAGVEALDAASP